MRSLALGTEAIVNNCVFYSFSDSIREGFKNVVENDLFSNHLENRFSKLKNRIVQCNVLRCAVIFLFLGHGFLAVQNDTFASSARS